MLMLRLQIRSLHSLQGTISDYLRSNRTGQSSHDTFTTMFDGTRLLTLLAGPTFKRTKRDLGRTNWDLTQTFTLH